MNLQNRHFQGETEPHEIAREREDAKEDLRVSRGSSGRLDSYRFAYQGRRLDSVGAGRDKLRGLIKERYRSEESQEKDAVRMQEQQQKVGPTLDKERDAEGILIAPTSTVLEHRRRKLTGFKRSCEMKEVELVRGVDAAAAVHKPILKRHGTIVFSMTRRDR